MIALLSSWFARTVARGGRMVRARITIDGSGAVTAVTPSVITATHTGTPNGKYTVTIPGRFYAWSGGSAGFAKDANSRNDHVRIRSVTFSGGTATCILQTQTASGTDGLLASGDILLDLELRDNTL